MQTALGGARNAVLPLGWSQPVSLHGNQPRSGPMDPARDQFTGAVWAVARPRWQPHQNVDSLRGNGPVFVRHADIRAVGDAAIDPVGPRRIRVYREIDEPLRPDHHANIL